MKSFLSSLHKLDSSAHALRDRKASHRQSQLFTALKFMKSKKRLDKKLEMTSSWASQSRRIARVSLTITLFGKVVLGIFVASTFPASAAPVSVNVCFKTGSELDLNQSFNANTRVKLTNPAYFGSTGTAAPETFVFNTLASVTSATLTSNNCQIYFGGGTSDVTSTEATAINDWVQSPGRFVLAGCDYTNNFICTTFRSPLTSIANGGVSINSALSYNPLTCGGALSVETFGGASTYFGLLAGDTLLAKHNTTAQQPAAITDSLVNPKFLFTGDADMFGSSGATAIGTGATASTNQAKFVVNSFKFGLDAIKGRLGNPQCFASYDQKADLALSISTSNASPVVGGQTTVTVTVVNQSLNNVTGVAAIVNLPAGLSLASQTGIGSYSAATQAWSIGSLNGGASATITLTLNVTSADSLTIPAQISQSSLADIDSSTNVGFGVDDLNDGIADDDEASVVVGNSMIDYGDAPITGTAPNGTGTNAYGSATHIVVAGIKLGATIDAETTSIASADASGDGTDDDGISSFPALNAGATSYSIPTANITATGTGTLHAWIDFNKNGTFDVGEYTSVAVAANIPAGALNWTGITAGAAGNTFARFRFTSDTTVTASTPSGTATNGEVEDYQVSITGAAPITPFKDRINSCGLITFDSNSEGFRAATITDNGTNYNAFTISPQSAPYANGARKFEWQSIGNPGGSIFTDDLDGQWTIFTTPDFGTDTNFSFLNSKSLTFDYRSDTGISGTYDFWVALVGKNGQKVFYSFKTQLSGASTTAFSKVVVPMDATKWFTTFQNPSSATPTSTAFTAILNDLDRIDIGAEGISGPDHTEIDNMGMACDRGDAPNTYGTLAAASGPSHQITSALKLGTKIDAENNGQPTSTANGDDQDLSASNQIGVIDDEDGITAFPALTVGGTTYSIPVANITAVNTTGGVATLHAWIDFNKNGTFEATEYTSTTINTSGVATGPLSWTTGFTIGSSGSTFARFRLTKDASIIATTPSGIATDGEVEDYQVSIAAAASPAKLLLVKRITAINGVNLNVYKDDTDNTALHADDDNNVNWSTPLNTNAALGDTTISTFLRGAIDGGKVKPGDTIEYTIYFLNAGGGNASNVRVCDRITGQQKFLSGSTIQLQQNSATPTTLTSIADADRATFYASSSDPAITKCNFTGTPTIDNGAIMVDVTGATGSPTWTTLLGSTGPGTTNTYGMVRFTTKVNP
jgi:uncharacterized repeat protein (TIGR01451 family)